MDKEEGGPANREGNETGPIRKLQASRGEKMIT